MARSRQSPAANAAPPPPSPSPGRLIVPAVLAAASLPVAWLLLPEGLRSVRSGRGPMLLLALVFLASQAGVAVAGTWSQRLPRPLLLLPATVLVLLGLLGTQLGLGEVQEALLQVSAERRLDLLHRGLSLARTPRVWGLQLAGLSALVAAVAGWAPGAGAPTPAARPGRTAGWAILGAGALLTAALFGGQLWDTEVFARGVLAGMPTQRVLAHGDVELCASTAQRYPDDGALLVVVGRQALRVGGQRVATRPELDAVAVGERPELLVGALLDALVVRAQPRPSPRHRLHEEPESPPKRRALEQGNGSPPLLLAVDRAAPFELLTRVAYTAAQAGFDRLRLGVGNPAFPGEELRAIPLAMPRVYQRRPRGPAEASPSLRLAVRVTTEAVLLHGVLRLPGAASGPLRVAHLQGRPDTMGLYNHARRIKETYPEQSEVTVLAESEVPVWQLVAVLDALRRRLPGGDYQDRSVFERDLRGPPAVPPAEGEPEPLFPAVQLAVGPA